MNTYLYLIFLVLIFISITMTVISINPIHSIMWVLILTINIGASLLCLNQHFTCFILVIVYIGAITILFLFVIMMIDESKIYLLTDSKNYILPVILIAIQTLVILINKNKIDFLSSSHYDHSSLLFDINDTLQTLAHLLYSDYLLNFAIVTIILLIGLIASISIAMKNHNNE